jgi:hypothetical protein
MPTNFKEPMAQWSIKEWAVRLVGDLVSKEAELIASKDGDLLLKSLSRRFVGQTTEVIEPGRMVEKGLRDTVASQYPLAPSTSCTQAV